MTNIEIVDLSGDEALVRTTIVVYAVGREPGSEIRDHGLGTYDDRVVWNGHRWQFAERRLHLDRSEYFAPGWASSD
jgi:hypothetical protein